MADLVGERWALPNRRLHGQLCEMFQQRQLPLAGHSGGQFERADAACLRPRRLLAAYPKFRSCHLRLGPPSARDPLQPFREFTIRRF